MNKNITYAIEMDTGLVYSRVGGECAGPVLDFGAIGQGGDGFAPGDFNGPTRYRMEKMPLHDVYPHVRWTKGHGARGVPAIPVELKNRHREFWGFRPLPVPDPAITAAGTLITSLTQAARDEDAQAVVKTAPIRVLRAAADLLHIEAGGHGRPWLGQAVTREARA